MPDLIGATLGPYRITEQIGRGGMATVFKAYHPATDRMVAVKVLPEQLADDPMFLQRFEREAHVVASLQHVHILPVFDYGQERGITYLVMPYIQTGTLKEYLHNGLPVLEETVRLFCQIAEAVDYAHRKNIIHRDLKPANVLLDDSGNALLTDFGLTRMAEGSTALTGTGVIGTPAYMSPEQGQGDSIDTRSDIYSLGIMLYEMTVGDVPFSADTPVAVIFKHISQPLPLPHTLQPGIPESVERVILKALAKAPQDRYDTAGEMAAALRASLQQSASTTTTSLSDTQAPHAAAYESTATYTTHSDTADLTSPAQPTAAPQAATIASQTAPRPYLRYGLGAAAVIALLLIAGLVSGIFPTPTAAPAVEEPAATQRPLLLAQPPDTTIIYPCMLAEENAPGFCIDQQGHITRILEDGDWDLQSEDPGWSPDGQQFAFSASTGEGYTAIYIADRDGSRATMQPGTGGDHTPAWSPDGEWIVFSSGDGLALRSMATDETHMLWAGEPLSDYCVSHPQWSPDSTQVVASVMTPCNGEFPITRQTILLAVDGSSQTVLRETVHESDWVDLPNPCPPELAAFSPDGTQLALYDEECAVWLVTIANPEEVERLIRFPMWWTNASYPQWGGSE
jgi:tRNA A-37 threonylcarbamoyl transferase component Bud32